MVPPPSPPSPSLYRAAIPATSLSLSLSTTASPRRRLSLSSARVVRVVVVSFPVFFPARHLIIVELRVTARTQRVTPRRPVLPPAGPGVGSPCFSPPAMSVRSLKSPSRDTGPGAPAGLGIGVHPCGRNKCHLVRTALPSRLPGNRMTLAYPRVPPPQATPAPTPLPSHTAAPPRHLSKSWTPLPRFWSRSHAGSAPPKPDLVGGWEPPDNH